MLWAADSIAMSTTIQYTLSGISYALSNMVNAQTRILVVALIPRVYSRHHQSQPAAHPKIVIEDQLTSCTTSESGVVCTTCPHGDIRLRFRSTGAGSDDGMRPCESTCERAQGQKPMWSCGGVESSAMQGNNEGASSSQTTSGNTADVKFRTS